MSAPKNQAAWLQKTNTPLEVGDAPLPKPGAGKMVVKNADVAINPLDCCDVAGEVYEVSSSANRFRKGDRIIGHCINLVTGRPSDGAYALYTVVPADKAAILPDHIFLTDGVVVPFAVMAATCALSVKEPGPCMPGVSTSAHALPYPTLQTTAPSAGKTLVVYSASSSVGSMTTQIAVATGINVVGIAGAHNHDLVKRCGAAQVFDHKEFSVVESVINAAMASQSEFVGISTPSPLSRRTLATLPSSRRWAVVNVKTGMIFVVNDVATSVYRDFVTPALQSGKLNCLPPPTIVGKGLKHINDALKKSKAGVGATKLVVELWRDGSSGHLWQRSLDGRVAGNLHGSDIATLQCGSPREAFIEMLS